MVALHAQVFQVSWNFVYLVGKDRTKTGQQCCAVNVFDIFFLQAYKNETSDYLQFIADCDNLNYFFFNLITFILIIFSLFTFQPIYL